MNNQFENPFNYKLIYIFTIEDEKHKGLVKVGDATVKTNLPIDQITPNSKILNEAARERIKDYTNTAATDYKLLHTELAVRNARDRDGNILYNQKGFPELQGFRDYNVHRILKNSGFKRVLLKGSTSKEWFRAKKSDAVNAIQAYKEGKAFIQSSNSLEADDDFEFRPEQDEAIQDTIKFFKKKENKHYLWNAKMRFGKTLSALQVVKDLEMKKTLIVTHRPVVEEGWFKDFFMVFKDEDQTSYGSKSKANLNQLLHSQKEYDEKFIFFASIQDLRGSKQAGGAFDKNEDVFSTDWDMVIIDEAHEGTQTELGENTLNELIKENTKVLYLSGTPFNIQNQFGDNETFVWDYISEQKAKEEWALLHEGDSNPYEDLPALKMFTYDLQDDLKNVFSFDLDEKAFNFKEFFRTTDSENNPRFIHEDAVRAFLNLMIKDDKESNYPFSNESYRDFFKHSLWLVPGVKEAKALSNLLKDYPVFGTGFDIINVAGEGDEDRSGDSLFEVKEAIKNAETNNKGTITISCGRLTTGVTVPEWTAVFMLSGSSVVSAAAYLQTIFRVQTPATINGKSKNYGYVFDFAPDRALNMVAKAASVSTKPGKSTNNDRLLLGDFLNFCPVIAMKGSRMEPYNVGQMLRKLKRAYAERVVLRGFDENRLYNDELLKLTEDDINELEDIRGIIGTTGTSSKMAHLNINDQGFTNEEYEELNKISNKRKKKRSKEEEELLEKLKRKKEARKNAISILRGISVRMPLLIYGADIPFEEDITLDKFVDLIDEASWKEFMPSGVTKSMFRKLERYYDEDVFIEAGRLIREKVKQADAKEPIERVKDIANLFSSFKNPDKETVLTPWPVVNRHMSDTLGGFSFFDEEFKTQLDTPNLINRGEVTKNVYSKNTRLLEINSKTGLYPLYLASTLYLLALKDNPEFIKKTVEEKYNIWKKVVDRNLFILCKTDMAKKITKRTLLGYREGTINSHNFVNLSGMLSNKPDKFVKKITKQNFWKKDGQHMKFNAVVGNPPYHETISKSESNSSLAKQLFPHFIMGAIQLKPDYISLITPSRWYTGEGQDKSFLKLRNFIREHDHIEKLVNFPNNKDLFSNVEISGGVCYFLYNSKFRGDVVFKDVRGNTINSSTRPLFEDDLDIIIANNNYIDIINKVIGNKSEFMSMMEITTGRDAFGITGKEAKKITNEESFSGSIKLRCAYEKIKYVHPDKIKKNKTIMNSWKVFISKGNGSAGLLSNEGPVKIIGKPFIGEPKSACTDSLIPIGAFENEYEAQNLQKYMQTKFLRFMVGILKTSQNLYQNVYRFVPLQDFSNSSDINWETTISEIDQQLYEKYKLSEEQIDEIESKILSVEDSTEKY